MDKFLKKKYKIIILIICVLGILVRGIYIINNGVDANNYDTKVWKLQTVEDYKQAYKFNEDNIGNGGHLYYILLLYQNFELPNSAVGQYYHPPLHHYISAIWLRGMDLLPLNEIQKIESLQVISFIYSIIILLFSYKILEELKVGEKGKVLTMILLNFFPLFIYMSGFINNDILLTLFIIINFYYLIKYNKEPNYKNAIIIALTLGLGMMTKTSMIVMLVPAIVIWFKKLIELNNKEEKISKLIYQLLIFIIIVAPLSLWHQIRLMYLFDWVFLGVQMPYDHFSVKDASFLERWGFISKDLLFNKITIENNNIFSYVINSALYCLGEFTNRVSYILKLITIILILITVFVIIKNTISKKKEKTKSIVLLIFFIWIIAFIYFNISMPYSCTMHSRYIAILFIISMIILGLEIDNSKNKYWILFVYLISIILAILSTYIVLI